MLLPRVIAGMLLLVMTFLGAGTAAGQAYPSKPVRFYTGSPGSANDVTTRLIAQGIAGPLGQPVVVDNRPPGHILGLTVAKAPPDGYAMMLIGSSFWIGTLLEETPYDAVRDFAPITEATIMPLILVVPPSLPVNSVKELIALARAKPGALNYASGAPGGPAHLGPELFKYMAGKLDIVQIPYKGGGDAVIGVMSGQVQMMIGATGSVMPSIKSGKLKALAVTSAKPTILAPGLQTIAASGVPGYEFAGGNSVFAPAKTPPALISRLNREIVKVLNSADVKEKFLNSGAETVGSTPEELAIKLKAEMETLGKLIKEVGIKVN